MSKEASNSQAAARVGKYLMLDILGEGAFGKVRTAVDENTGRQFAIKIMEKSHIKANELTVQVRREIAVMKAMKHPNIVNLHEVLTSSKNLYMVMDLVTGGELFDAVAETGKLPEARARLYFQQLVDGIVYCHSRRVYHRDLKPENILLTEDKQVIKITDFGLSSIKAANSSTELLHTIMGSPHYIAPEIITSAAAGYDGSKVDVWASGVILFGMLAGFLPFDDPITRNLYRAIVHQQPAYPKHFSYDAIKLIRAMLQKDPSKRPTMEEVKSFTWFKVNYQPAVVDIVEPASAPMSTKSRKSRARVKKTAGEKGTSRLKRRDTESRQQQAQSPEGEECSNANVVDPQSALYENAGGPSRALSSRSDADLNESADSFRGLKVRNSTSASEMRIQAMSSDSSRTVQSASDVPKSPTNEESHRRDIAALPTVPPLHMDGLDGSSSLLFTYVETTRAGQLPKHGFSRSETGSSTTEERQNSYTTSPYASGTLSINTPEQQRDGTGRKSEWKVSSRGDDDSKPSLLSSPVSASASPKEGTRKGTAVSEEVGTPSSGDKPPKMVQISPMQSPSCGAMDSSSTADVPKRGASVGIFRPVASLFKPLATSLLPEVQSEGSVMESKPSMQVSSEGDWDIEGGDVFADVEGDGLSMRLPLTTMSERGSGTVMNELWGRQNGTSEENLTSKSEGSGGIFGNLDSSLLGKLTPSQEFEFSSSRTPKIFGERRGGNPW